VNERVRKLIGGFVRTGWKTIAVAWLVSLAAAWSTTFAASRASGSGIGWLSFDLFRAVAVAMPVTGMFFIDREVVTLPVSIKDMWRARWLLVTVGLTALSVSARGVAVLTIHGAGVDAGEFVWVTAIEFLSAGTCATCAVFLLKTPDQVAKQSAVLRWVAGLTWLSMPGWCYYARLYVSHQERALSPVFAALFAVLALVTYLGFRAVPTAHHARLPLGANAGERTADLADAGRSKADRWRGVSGAGDGVRRWVWRELAWAVAFGLVGVLFITAMEVWITGDRGLTFLQGMSGIFLPDGNFGMGFYPVLGLMWIGRITANLRLLRIVPVSTWTVAGVITVGLVVSWTTVWLLQEGAYRWSLGVWPGSPPFSTFLLILACVATVKTALLILGSRYFVVFAIGILQTSVFTIMRFGPFANVPAIPAALGSIGIVTLLLFADHIVLTRTSRIYRPSKSIV
jgi:hypothetical protein